VVAGGPVASELFAEGLFKELAGVFRFAHRLFLSGHSLKR
jgi:hypothetical protein